MTFCRLISGVVSLNELLNNACRSGQCMSAEEKVKKNVGASTLLIIAFKSSLALCQ